MLKVPHVLFRKDAEVSSSRKLRYSSHLSLLLLRSERSERAAHYSQLKKCITDSFAGTLCRTRVSDCFGL